MMMTAAKKDDDSSLYTSAAKWVISLGVVGALIVVTGALIWLVSVMSQQNQSTSDKLVQVTASAVDKLPTIAAEMRDDNRRDGEFMRQHTALATAAREQINARLTAMETRLVELRSDQQESSRALMEAIRKLLDFLERTTEKNARTPPPTKVDGA